MKMVKDYFGNKISVGDKIIFARTSHTSLAIGEVTSIVKHCKTCTYQDTCGYKCANLKKFEELMNEPL